METITKGPYVCCESNQEVLTELYDEHGRAMTYAQILDVMNGPNFDAHGLIAEWTDRTMTIGKHHAVNVATIREVLSELEELGEYTAADVIRWLVWWKELLSQRADRFAKELLSSKPRKSSQES